MIDRQGPSVGPARMGRFFENPGRESRGIRKRRRPGAPTRAPRHEKLRRKESNSKEPTALPRSLGMEAATPLAPTGQLLARAPVRTNGSGQKGRVLGDIGRPFGKRRRRALSRGGKGEQRAAAAMAVHYFLARRQWRRGRASNATWEFRESLGGLC